MRKRTALGITISKVIGICIFLIVLAVLNSLELSGIGLAVVQYLNMSLLSIIMFSILLYLGELFSIFPLPLNLPYPIFNAFGGVFLTWFIIQIIYLVGKLFNQNITKVLGIFENLILTLVFLLVIVIGYLMIIIGLIPKGKCKEHTKEKKPKEKEVVKKKVKKRSKKSQVEWDDVGNEFKMAFFNLGRVLKETLEPKKKKKKKIRKKKK